MSDKSDRTREKILNTAKEHFLKDGYSGASLRNIVKDAGLTTGAFYKYYRAKEDLFNDLIDPYVEHIYQIYDDILANFESLSASNQTRSMAEASTTSINQMVDYIYDNYDNFRLLYKCGDTGKYEDVIHNMVSREIKSTYTYMKTMHKVGIKLPELDESFMHMIYTGFFSSIFQIIEHDIDKETAKKNIALLKNFQTGGWERLFHIQFPE